MQTMEMKKNRRAKVEFEKNKDLLIENYGKLETIIQANNCLNEQRTLNLELVLARHASSYGLLGATFLPSETGENTLYLEVRFNNEKSLYIQTMSNDKNCTYLGLNETYAHSVLSSAIQYFENRKVPKGKLIFDTAAQCDVGSSVVLFSCLTKILLDILLNEYDKSSEELIECICEKQIAKM